MHFKIFLYNIFTLFVLYAAIFVTVAIPSKTDFVKDQIAFNKINTETVDYTNTGMNHIEGGWPKDINFSDPEQTLRFRKKIEKDEMYIHTLQQLLVPMERCIRQNNFINIYEMYFAELCGYDTILTEENSPRTGVVFRDPCLVKRPVIHVSWSPDGGSRVAVTHSNLSFQKSLADQSIYSYIWQIDNPNKPEVVIDAGNPVMCLEYNPRDSNNLAGGLYDGQVAFWDIRRASTPSEVCNRINCFRDPVMNVLWINSKSGTEFFSSSTDGQLKWWDIRKLSEPLETLIIDIEKGEKQIITNALGVSSLEYEPTIPTRFMVGTENGKVICGNRKGKTGSEKLGAVFNAHHGPVTSVQRNPAFLKNFLTVGDWTARIWSEDCKESSIIWTSYNKTKLTKGTWSPSRPSVFFINRLDGTLEIWDVLHKQREPFLRVKVCDEALYGLRAHESGEFIAVGNVEGSTYVLQLPENLIRTDKNDKSHLTAMFDRESRREKIIEGKLREQRLKMKSKQDLGGQKENVVSSWNLNPEQLNNLTEEFLAEVRSKTIVLEDDI